MRGMWRRVASAESATPRRYRNRRKHQRTRATQNANWAVGLWACGGTRPLLRKAAARALSAARTPRIARAASHTPPQQQPQPQGSTTHTYAALRAAPRTAPARTAPPPVAAPPNSGHHARTTTHDDEKMLRAPTGTKPEILQETPIDGRWGTTAELGARSGSGVAAFLPPPMMRRAACTATRPSSSFSALRFNSTNRSELLLFRNQLRVTRDRI